MVGWIHVGFFDEGAAVMELYVFCGSGFGGSCAIGVVGVGDNGVVWEGDSFDAIEKMESKKHLCESIF